MSIVRNGIEFKPVFPVFFAPAKGSSQDLRGCLFVQFNEENLSWSVYKDIKTNYVYSPDDLNFSWFADPANGWTVITKAKANELIKSTRFPKYLIPNEGNNKSSFTKWAYIVYWSNTHGERFFIDGTKDPTPEEVGFDVHNPYWHEASEKEARGRIKIQNNEWPKWVKWNLTFDEFMNVGVRFDSPVSNGVIIDAKGNEHSSLECFDKWQKELESGYYWSLSTKETVMGMVGKYKKNKNEKQSLVELTVGQKVKFGNRVFVVGKTNPNYLLPTLTLDNE